MPVSSIQGSPAIDSHCIAGRISRVHICCDLTIGIPWARWVPDRASCDIVRSFRGLSYCTTCQRSVWYRVSVLQLWRFWRRIVSHYRDKSHAGFVRHGVPAESIAFYSIAWAVICKNQWRRPYQLYGYEAGMYFPATCRQHECLGSISRLLPIVLPVLSEILYVSPISFALRMPSSS